jgi:HSP20 family protein
MEMVISHEIGRLVEEFSRLSAVGALTTPGLPPRTDVIETDKEIEITTEMPGLERKDIEISLDGIDRGREASESRADDRDFVGSIPFVDRHHSECVR